MVSGQPGLKPEEDPTTEREPLRVLLSRTAKTTIIFTVVFAAAGVWVSQSWWAMAALLLVAPVLGALAAIDLEVHRLPTPLVRVVAGIGLAVGIIAGATGTWSDLGRSVLAALGVSGAFFGVWLVTRGGTGLGDVRLSGALAFYTGAISWEATWWFILAAHLVAFPVAIYRLLRKRRDSLPFGPALIVGWYLTLGLVAYSAPS